MSQEIQQVPQTARTLVGYFDGYAGKLEMRFWRYPYLHNLWVKGTDMSTCFDRFHKDKQYFIDGSTYNCPFCNRGNIKYTIEDRGSYDGSNHKVVYFYIIKCSDCSKESLHLSKFNLKIDRENTSYESFEFPPSN